MTQQIKKILIITGLAGLSAYWYIVFIRIFEIAEISLSIPPDKFIVLFIFTLFSVLLSLGSKRALEKFTSIKPSSIATFLLSATGSITVVFFLLLFLILWTSPEGIGNGMLRYDQFIELIVLTNFQVLVVLTYLGFQFLRDYNQSKIELEESRRQQLEYQIKLYQQQLDPHFLFNNLNVISAFIETEKEQAQNYLKKFSEIYHYIVQTKNEELVPLEQEISHIQNYLFLLKKRFLNAYEFNINIDTDSFFIIPNSVQIALENVIKHNSGNKENPLVTNIFLDNGYIVIRNQKKKKASEVFSHQTGLNNLNKLCELILDQSLNIIETEDYFSVSIPILGLEK